MTLIIAANLSDRVYISADTKLSRRFPDRIEVVHDNQLKIEPLSGNIIVACAGLAGMSSYIINQLKQNEISRQGIREFRELVDLHIREIVGNYLAKTGSDYTESNVVLIFAGYDMNHQRTLSGEKMFSLTGEYQQLRKEWLANMFGGKDIQDFTQEELRLFAQHMMSGQQVMKGVIFDSPNTAHDGVIELPIPDHSVFAVEINCSAPDDEKFKYFDCEWGEYIVRGRSLTNEAIPREFFGDLDFNANAGDIQRDAAPFVTWIHQYFSETVGGAITNFVLIEGKILQTTGAVGFGKQGDEEKKLLYATDVIDGHLHRLDLDGQWKKLEPLSKFASLGECLL